MPTEGRTTTRRSAFAKGSSYIPGLDGLRALAFFMVFFAHAGGSDFGGYIPATLGVTIFFFLSGYLITTLLRRELEVTGTISLKDFYIRRTLRIFAPLYVTYAFASLLAYLCHMVVGNWQGALSMLFYVFNYADNIGFYQLLPHGMDVIWSLAVEEHFYLLFPLGMLVMWRKQWPWKKQAWLLTGLCVLALAWRIFITMKLGVARNWTYRATDSRFDSILWGSVLALAFNPRFQDKPLLKPRYAVPMFVLSLVLLGSTMLDLGHNEFFRQTVRYSIQSVLLLPIFSFVITRSDHPLVSWLETPVMRYLGWLSYGLYLCHLFLLHTIQEFTPSMTIRIVGGLALSLTYAILMRYTLELPLQHVRARFRHVPENDPSAPGGHGLIS